MNPDTLPDLTREVRLRRVDDVRVQLARHRPENAARAIFQERLLAAADELEEQLDDGVLNTLAREMLWSLVHLAPGLLAQDDACGPPDEPTDVDLIEAREVAGRLRHLLTGPGACGPRAKHYRLLALMFETVELMASFPAHPVDVYDEGVDLLRAGTAFLEGMVEEEER